MSELANKLRNKLTPDQRRAIRLKLGLSQPQLALVLESSVDTVSRMERNVEKPTYRGAPLRVDQLLRAYEKGFRPTGWPTDKRAGRSGRPVKGA